MILGKVTTQNERSVTMKIYLFNPETGVYQGEDFADNLPICQGREAIPPHATTIAPPPFEHGEVPVFTVAGERWEIQLVAAPVVGCGDNPCDQASRLSRRQTFRQMC